MSWGVLLWVYPIWNSLGFLDFGDYFLPNFREVFNYYLLKDFLMVFLSSSSGTPILRMLERLILFWVRIYTPFLRFLSREDPLAFVGELVWWC